MKLLAVFTVLAIASAGCFGSGGDSPLSPSDEDLARQLPAESALAELRLMQNAPPHRAWFDAYSMEDNPGAADPTLFSNRDSVVPVSAYGAMYAHPDDPDAVLFAFSYGFRDSDHLDEYLEADLCANVFPGRHYLQEGTTLTQVVIDALDDDLRQQMITLADGAAQEIADRTGAAPLCGEQ